MKKRKKTINKIVMVATAIWLVGVTTFSICMAVGEAKGQNIEPTTTVESVVYDVPIDIELLDHIQGLCADYEIPVELVLAMIEVESSYKADAVSPVGAQGLMQVIPEYHEDRMNRLNCTDLFNPYHNVTVGMDYLAELIDEYDGSLHKALTAYNHGPKGAKDKFFGQGTYQTEYSLKVLNITEKIEKGMTTMNFTDDPVKDEMRYTEEKEKQLAKLPKCSYCNEPIQDDELFDIDGTLYCEEHAFELFRKNAEDYYGGV